MKELDPIDRLRPGGSQWPTPSADLRARVAEIPVQRQPIAWSDRVWYSRRGRAGFAAAVLAVVVTDVFGARHTVPVAAQAPPAETAVLEELVRFAGLPDEAAASIARRTAMMLRSSAVDSAPSIPGEDR